MPMTVRPLNVADREAWGPLWQGYLEFYKTELAPEITDVTWSRLLDPAEGMHSLITENESGEMIGIVHYLYHRVTWAVADRYHLEDRFVAEAARGTGAGRALIEAVYAAADARGADQVYWLTQNFNTDGRRLYDRVGRVTPFIKYQRLWRAKAPSSPAIRAAPACLPGPDRITGPIRWHPAVAAGF